MKKLVHNSFLSLPFRRLKPRHLDLGGLVGVVYLTLAPGSKRVDIEQNDLNGPVCEAESLLPVPKMLFGE